MKHIQCKTEVKDGIESRIEECPEGWVIIDTYHPCSSVVPWESYGRNHQQELTRVLDSVNIESLSLQTQRKSMCPRGSGPGGRVRFGDDMLPGIYYVAVKTEQQDAAIAALAEHRLNVENWLKGLSPIPEACRR